jgi:hypothetical protein
MLVAGLVGLALAIGCAVMAYLARRRLRSLTAVETLRVQDVRQLHEAARDAAGPGQFRYRCEVVGTAQPGGSGLLVSQLKELECVWHKHKITHKYWETTRDSHGNRKRQQRSKVVSRHASTDPFLVQDATGTIEVAPHKGINGADKVLDRFEKDSGGNSKQLSIGSLSLSLPSSNSSIGYQHEEWALLPGRQLFVHGEASDAQGTLVIGPPADGGLYLVSTRSQEQLLKSENGRMKGFGIGAAVAAVAGLVLLLVGAVAG